MPGKLLSAMTRFFIYYSLPVFFLLRMSGAMPCMAVEDDASLEFKLKAECRRAYKAQVKECEMQNANDKDQQSGLLESCLEEAKNIFKDCVDDAKVKSQSEEEKDKKGRDKEELLKRWTF